MDCQAPAHIVPRIGNARCGAAWGPDTNFVSIPGTAIAATIFQKMTQFLAADPKRIGLYLRSQFEGVRIASEFNGQAVPITSTMGTAPGAGGTFELTLWAGPGLYLASPWFWARASTGPPSTSLDQLITWIEFFETAP